jgi:small ligand-binding sensory domain FIST
VCVRGRTGADWGAALASLAQERSSGHPSLLVFAKHEGFTADALDPLGDVRGLASVFGGGTVATPAVAIIDRGGRVTRGDAAGMFLHGAWRPVVRAATACKLLTALEAVTATHGSMVLRIGEQPALDVLEQAGKDLSGQQQILVVLADPATEPDRRADLLVRAVQGVDPARRGLVVGDDVRPGLRIALAVRDANAARTELEAAVREVARDSAGGAPRFGLYINCAGRGAALYGQRDVDTRILKARFGDLPLAGMQSSFEIAPHMGRPTFQLYTGVFGLFSAPS